MLDACATPTTQAGVGPRSRVRSGRIAPDRARSLV